MSKIKPVRWMASGVRDLQRNGAWLVSKALKPSVAVADRLPGPDPVGLKLKRAEAAVTQAQEAEQRALTAANEANERAEIARQVAEQAKERVREATRAAKEEVDRRTREARERANRMVDEERQQASREVNQQVEQIAAEAEQQTGQARDEAAEVAGRAQELIDIAHRQMAEARTLAAEATEAAQEAAEQARAQARAVSERAEERAERITSAAGRATEALADTGRLAARQERLGDQTKTQLLELARPLGIDGTSRMNKEQLVRAVRSASRRKGSS